MMKAMLAILVLVIGTVGVVLTRESSDDHRTCSCSGALCTCEVTCLDVGEMPTCICAALTCTCKCVPKDESNAQLTLPTMNADQHVNSGKAEKYFRDLGTSTTVSIANGIKSLREAILAGDATRYHATAATVEASFASLTTNQKAAWDDWSSKNLKR